MATSTYCARLSQTRITVDYIRLKNYQHDNELGQTVTKLAILLALRIQTFGRRVSISPIILSFTSRQWVIIIAVSTASCTSCVSTAQDTLHPSSPTTFAPLHSFLSARNVLLYLHRRSQKAPWPISKTLAIRRPVPMSQSLYRYRHPRRVQTNRRVQSVATTLHHCGDHASRVGRRFDCLPSHIGCCPDVFTSGAGCREFGAWRGWDHQGCYWGNVEYSSAH